MKQKITAFISEGKNDRMEFIKKFNDLRTKFKMSRRNFVFLLVVIALAGGVYFYKGLIIAAMVNGQPIFRLSLIRELEKQSGQKALDSLITKVLILQEAQRQKVIVTDAEVNQSLKTLEDNVTKQGSNLDQLLAAQGMTRDGLKEQIKLQKIVEKIVGKDVSVTDKEVSDYIEKNKSLLPKDAKPEEVKENVKQQLQQQKISEKANTWIESLRTSAKINYFVQF